VPVFDAHLHIIDPQFPLVANDGYLPQAFTCDDYLARTSHLGVRGGAIVSGSFQGFDQTYLLAALRRLGPGFVGVTQLPADTTDAEILRLDAAGVRAVRFNLVRGGSEDVSRLDRLARRVHALAGWHVELYIASRDLPDLYSTLAALPAVSIDHLGLTKDGFATLLRLVEVGARVKASGFGRVELDVADALRAIADANPAALMFGSDLPSTRAPRPFADSDLDRVCACLPAAQIEPVLARNAEAWYRIAPL
jgi:predicted TIM-barrel fold metal-dependent hydrolase